MMPHSCAGRAFHIIVTSASCWGMSKTIYSVRWLVRGTNSGHEMQVVQERPVI
jgi:hypothetical protein